MAKIPMTPMEQAFLNAGLVSEELLERRHTIRKEQRRKAKERARQRALELQQAKQIAREMNSMEMAS